MEYLKHFNPNHDPSNGQFTFGNEHPVVSDKQTFKKVKKAYNNETDFNCVDHYKVAKTLAKNIKVSDDDIQRLRDINSQILNIKEKTSKHDRQMAKEITDKATELYNKELQSISNDLKGDPDNIYLMALDCWDNAAFEVEDDYKAKNPEYAPLQNELSEYKKKYFQERENLGKKYAGEYADYNVTDFPFFRNGDNKYSHVVEYFIAIEHKKELEFPWNNTLTEYDFFDVKEDEFIRAMMEDTLNGDRNGRTKN